MDGKDGYTPVKGKDYFDGQPGKDGQDGSPGKDGVDGYTPIKGIDYFTEADKAEIVEDVLDQIEIPESGGAVLDVQVDGTSVLSNGIANIPKTSGSVWGVVRVGGSANGEMHTGNTNGRVILRYPVTNASGLTNRKSQGTQYGGVIDASNFDLAVKTAMTDGKGETWTETQKTAARARMGAVGTTDYATFDSAGVVKVANFTSGLYVDESGNLTTSPATEYAIDTRQTDRAITPTNLDYAIKKGLADNKLEWTEEEKAAARARMGAVSFEEVLANLPIYNGEVIPV